MKIEPSVSGYIIETSVGCVEFEIYEGRVILESARFMGMDILKRLTEAEQREICADIMTQVEKDRADMALEYAA